MYDVRTFPKAFQCYRPTTERVYGTICMTPQNKILLVRGRRSRKWSFPKGHKESGEAYLDCAIRETFEETGVNLRGVNPVSYQKLSVGEYYFFEIEEKGIMVNDISEVIEARWMTIDEIRAVYSNVDVSNFLWRMKRSKTFFRSWE